MSEPGRGADRPKAPWWQINRSARFCFVGGGLWLALAVLTFVVMATDSRDTAWYNWLMLAVAIMFAALYLASGVTARRYERRGAPPAPSE